MDDLISRKAAIEAIDKIFPADPMRNDYTQGITCGAALAEEYIKQLPSAQSEIVRCKECVYAADDDYHHCTRVTWWNSDDDFCSKGKRRTDGM